MAADEAQASCQGFTGAGHLSSGCPCPASCLLGLGLYKATASAAHLYPLRTSSAQGSNASEPCLLQAACSCCA